MPRQTHSFDCYAAMRNGNDCKCGGIPLQSIQSVYTTEEEAFDQMLKRESDLDSPV